MGGTFGRSMDPTSSDFMGGYGATVDPLNLGGRGGDARSSGLKNSGGKNGGPTPPDFQAAAEEQARTSRNDVNGSFGGASWTQMPDGRWSLNMSMSPELQAAAQNLQGQIGSQAPLTTREMGPAPEARFTDVGTFQPGGNMLDPTATRDQSLDAAYRMQTSRLDPRFDQERGALEARLANEGFSRGDAGWNQEMDRFNRSRDDAYQQALLAAQSGAGNTAFGQALGANQQSFGQGLQAYQTNAQNQLAQNAQNFGQDLSSYQADLAGERQNFAERLSAAMTPYQQLQALQGIGEGAGRGALAQAQPVDALGAAGQQYGGALQQYGIQQQQKNSKNGAAASSLPLLLAASDERLKTEIERLPVEAIPGVPFARWTWRDGSGASFGVIAQDVEKVRPDLVVEVDGFKRVAYGPLLRGE